MIDKKGERDCIDETFDLSRSASSFSPWRARLGVGVPRRRRLPARRWLRSVSVIQKDVPIYSEWIATLNGYVNAQIQPQVTGYLIKQDYREGSLVHQGDVLFEIDPRPFQAVLDQAKAQLAQAEAQLGTAELNVKRDIPEAEAHAIPQSQLDNDTNAELAGKATVQADQAAIEQAELNLGFTKVRSLIDGIAGIAQVQVGNLVGPATVLTGVSQVNPIKAYFPITGVEYLQIANRLSPGTVNLLSRASPIPLELILSEWQRRMATRGGFFSPTGRWISKPEPSRSWAPFPIPAIFSGPGRPAASAPSRI